MTTIAVDFQYLDCSIWLMVFTRKCLLVERVGVAGVAVLVGRRLQEADRRHVPVLERLVEQGQVVLVVGLVGVTDGRFGRRRQVLGVGRGLVVLERVMVRHVVLDHRAADVLVRRAAHCVTGGLVPVGANPPWNQPQEMSWR